MIQFKFYATTCYYKYEQTVLYKEKKNISLCQHGSDSTVLDLDSASTASWMIRAVVKWNPIMIPFLENKSHHLLDNIVWLPGTVSDDTSVETRDSAETDQDTDTNDQSWPPADDQVVRKIILVQQVPGWPEAGDGHNQSWNNNQLSI